MTQVRTAPLPCVDTHTTVVEAGAEEAWRAVADVLDGSTANGLMSRYTRLIGCADRTASGPRPLDVGSTVRGFRVTVARPGRELGLTGRHRLATYALAFHLAPDGPGRTRVSAETRAVFPGPAGALYRLLVIGSGAHAAVMRRMLATIGRRAN
ncbi:hypothetical protein [Streptomyces collinus]|uniref:hypothetical protein n=1 Tax=Streptomyces collinus TaxID=42684 RepID=UPI0033DAEF5D